MDELKVKVDEQVSSELSLENNEYLLKYETEDSKKFVSLTMPVRKKTYSHKQLHPIFEMHLPEGYLLSIIKKHFSKIVRMDDFGLLKVMSPSIKGRLSYHSNKNHHQDALSIDDLLHPKSEKLFDELVHRFALNSALSGVQPKVLATIENKATLKTEDYIVKSWGDDYKELALNEHYCMSVVKQAGIAVPEFYISDDEKLFIMKRFDKRDEYSYYGFEDMCVLMAKQRDDKYESTCEQVVKIIKTFVSPRHKKDSLTQFYKMMILNYLLKNGDAHLKNFGLLYDGLENIWLAPAYDVVCTTTYIKKDVPALNLMGSKKWWDKKNLIKFGIQTCGLSNKEAHELYDTCVVARDSVFDGMSQRLKDEKNEDKKTIIQNILETK